MSADTPDHPAMEPPDPAQAAAALKEAVHRCDSLDLVVEVVEFRYRQERLRFQRQLVGWVIAGLSVLLSLGTYVGGLYIQKIIAEIRLEVRAGRDVIQETTADGVTQINRIVEENKDREYVR
ncbi:MAG: hypothetical protein OXQ29_17165 [Rhodospirillaceae bacterium]|nr:hypothetical protein [Rhodospirillaceae bacterium]